MGSRMGWRRWAGRCGLTVLVCLGPAVAALAQSAADRTEEPALVRLVQKAEEHARRGQLAPSLVAYERALEAGAGSAEVLNRVAELYLAQGNAQRAVELLQRSLIERPAQLPVYSGLNEAFLAMGRLDSAMHYVRQAMALAPENSGVRSQLAFLHLQTGEVEACRTQLDSALRIDPGNAHAHRLLALYHTQVDDPDSAIARYRMVLELSPDDVESHNNIAFLLGVKKQYLEALEWYRKTKRITADPNLLHAINLNMDAIRAIMDGKMRARFILVPTQSLARDILQQLEAGADFGQLAAQYSQAPNARDGGDLGFFGPGDMLPEVEQNVLRLGVGEVSPLIHIEPGYMLLQRLN